MKVSKEFEQQFNVSNITLSTFGVLPEPNFKELEFAAGTNKFSQLCGFKFNLASDPSAYFKVVFVAKFRGNVFHKTRDDVTGGNWYPDKGVRSMWYIMKPSNKFNSWDVISPKTCKLMFGFDINEFFETPEFNKGVNTFKKYINKGLSLFTKDVVDPKDSASVDKYKAIIQNGMDMMDDLQVWNRSEYTLVYSPQADGFKF